MNIQSLNPLMPSTSPHSPLSGLPGALRALLGAIGTRKMNELALARLMEGREPSPMLPPIKKATVATMCPCCQESIVEMDIRALRAPYCDPCIGR